jgi:hypothetical protein
MSLAVLRSRALAGMETLCVSVEVHLANGLPSLTIVGTNTPTFVATNVAQVRGHVAALPRGRAWNGASQSLVRTSSVNFGSSPDASATRSCLYPQIEAANMTGTSKI